MDIELLKLVFDYTKQGKLVDKSFLYKMIGIVVKSKDLHKYVKDVYLSDEVQSESDGIIIASYLPYYKIIKIYYYSLMEYLEKFESKYCYFSEFENLLCKNLMIMQFMLHELEHANQQKKYDNGNNFEAILLKEVMKYTDIKNIYQQFLNGSSPEVLLQNVSNMKELYAFNYKCAPHERLAEIISYREIVSMLNYIKENVSNLFEFENYNLLNQLIRGYEIGDNSLISPTIKYFLDGNMLNSLKNLSLLKDDGSIDIKFSFKFPLSERLLYGLPVSRNEYDEINRRLLLLNKY